MGDTKKSFIDRTFIPWCAFWGFILVLLVISATVIAVEMFSLRSMPTICYDVTNDTCYSKIGFASAYNGGFYEVNPHSYDYLLEGEIISRNKKAKDWVLTSLHNGKVKHILIKDTTLLVNYKTNYINKLDSLKANYKLDESKSQPLTFVEKLHWLFGTCWTPTFKYDFPLMRAKTNEEKLNAIIYRNYGRSTRK